MADIDPLGPGQPEAFAPGAPDNPAETAAPGKAAAARRPRRSLLRELPILIIVALVIAMLIKSFVVQAFVIPTGSMQDTLGIYDKILVNKVVYHLRPIHSGDIVVFDGTGSWNAPLTPSSTSANPLARAYDDTLRKVFDSVGGLFGTPIGQTDYVKRVIGVPGDHVICCNASGLITVNGVPLHEQSYLYPGDVPSSSPAGISGHFNVTVPAGYLWVLGDHRSISDDSRGHEADPGNGMIPEDQVIGRAFVVAWPLSQWRILSIPATFKQPGITRAAGAAAAPTPAETTAGLERGVSVRPAAPYLPTAAGFAATFPVWWVFRWVRGRRRSPSAGSRLGPRA
jgi:signal peptidase I